MYESKTLLISPLDLIISLRPLCLSVFVHIDYNSKFLRALNDTLKQCNSKTIFMYTWCSRDGTGSGGGMGLRSFCYIWFM